MIIYTIYKIVNRITGKVYIGFTSDFRRRISQHKTNSKTKQSKLYSSMRKHGLENFSYEIIYQSKDEKHCLIEMEPYFITENDSFNSGYNMTSGGDGTRNYSHSHEAREKIKINNARRGKPAHNRGKKSSLETRMKISKLVSGEKNPMYGVNFQDIIGPERELERCRKISDRLKNRILSDEHKEKLRRPKKVITCPHCGTTGPSNSINRYHMNKCKLFIGPIQ